MWQHESLLLDASPAENTINQYATDLMDNFSNEEAKVVLDSLRHAFCSYAYGGLHQLFTRQETENWYPKVILDEVLEPNDIDALPDIVSLYRGTDSQEFESQKYGQSWTTNKQIKKWDTHLSERRVATNKVTIAQGVYSSPQARSLAELRPESEPPLFAGHKKSDPR